MWYMGHVNERESNRKHTIKLMEWGHTKPDSLPNTPIKHVSVLSAYKPFQQGKWKKSISEGVACEEL